MRLKQIILIGFKSFAKRSVINVGDGLLGLVGPNGCGKSNIVDALRWVMGESRATQLRQELNTDIIFNGAAGQRAADWCSVELLLANDGSRDLGMWGEYAELSVRRQIEREGDSSYFINGQRVRRRDVVDLFAGTGSGARSYGIVEQERITTIVRAEPRRIRAHLEEAAGVAIYKERRRETESKIGSAQASLARLDDSTAELRRQRDALARQAQVTAKMREARARLEVARQLELTLRFEAVGAAADAAAAEAAAAAKDAGALRARHSGLEKEMEGLNKRRNARATEASKLQADYYKAVAAKEKRQQALRDYESQTRQEREQMEAATAEAKETAGRVEDLEAELAAGKERHKNLTAAAAAASAKISGAEQQEQAAAKRRDVAQQRLERADEEAAAAQAKRSESEAAARLAEHRRADQARRLLEAEHELEHLAPVEEPDAKALARVRERAERARREARDNEGRRQERSLELAEAKEEILRLQGEQGGLQAERELLREIAGKLKDRYADWLAARGLDAAATLAEASGIKAPGCEKAVDAVLGHLLEGFETRDLPALLGGGRDARGPGAARSGPGAAGGAAGGPAGGPAPAAGRGRGQAEVAPAAGLLAGPGFPGAGPGGGPGGAAAAGAGPAGGYGGRILLRAGRGEFAAQPPGRRGMEQPSQGGRGAAARAGGPDGGRARAPRRGRQGARGARGQGGRAAGTAGAGRRRPGGRRAGSPAAQARGRVNTHAEQSRRLRAAIERGRGEVAAHDKDKAAAARRQAEDAERAEAAAAAAARRAAARCARRKKRSRPAAPRAASSRAPCTRRGWKRGSTNSATAPSRSAWSRPSSRWRRCGRRSSGTKAASASATVRSSKARSPRPARRWPRPRRRSRRSSRASRSWTRSSRSRKRRGRACAPSWSGRKQRLRDGELAAAAKRAEGEAFKAQLAERSVDAAELAKLRERHPGPEEAGALVMRLEGRIERAGPVNYAAEDEHRACEERLAETEGQRADVSEALAALQEAIKRIDAEMLGRIKEVHGRLNLKFGEMFQKLFSGGDAAVELDSEDFLAADMQLKVSLPGKRGDQHPRAVGRGEDPDGAGVHLRAQRPQPAAVLRPRRGRRGLGRREHHAVLRAARGDEGPLAVSAGDAQQAGDRAGRRPGRRHAGGKGRHQAGGGEAGRGG